VAQSVDLLPENGTVDGENSSRSSWKSSGPITH